MNPESGTITYTYDDNSNLASKTDARPWTTTYGYDALNRNTTVDYSNTTVNPDINRYYDGAVNGKGRFWHDYAGGVTSGGQNLEHTAIDSYDLAGRPVTKRQLYTTNGAWSPTYQMSRYYNVSGQVTSQVYPAGRTTGPTYDNAGRQTGLSGTLGDGANRTYASNITYTAAGQMQEERFGTTTWPLYHKLRYNSRGQLYDIRLSTVPWATDPLNWNRGCLAFYHDSGYHWGGTPGIDTGPDNNGNVLRSQYYRPDNDQISTFSATQHDYTYDELNRLQQVTEWYQTGQGYSQQFVQAYLYDRWGNRTINTGLTSPVVNNLSFEVEAATNRLLAPGDTPLAPTNRKIRYDSVGNISNDSWSGYGDNTPGVITRTYDAENHMTSARDSVGGWAYYIYNAYGRRTRTKVSGQEKWFVYGFDGELVAEYAASSAAANPQKEYAYRNGQLLVTAEASANLRWLVTDHLGTPRMIAELTGSVGGIRRHDYLPFGEELPAGVGSRTTQQGYSGDGVKQKFTSKERDNETGLDYFVARYYTSFQGRFSGVDPFSIVLEVQEERYPEKARAKLRTYLSQPQQWNRYSYAINNPLLFVDPTGESIRLSNDPQERERQMQALREAVGPEAAAYLYVNQGTNADGSANYYVGIYDHNPTNGDRRSFEQVNAVAGMLGPAIRNPEVAKLEFVRAGLVQDDDGFKARIGRGGPPGISPAVTGVFKGVITIKMLDWSKSDLGYLPGNLMSNSKDNMLTPSVMLGHEIAHGLARMLGYKDGRDRKTSENAAVDMENKIRNLQYPGGPTRKYHNAPQP